MVKKYVRMLENREINAKTGSVWAIQDVPVTWRAKTQTQIEADNYYIDENDGTVYPVPINNEEE